jgi:hypothetical protein
MAGRAGFSTLRPFDEDVLAGDFEEVLADGLEDGRADVFAGSLFPGLLCVFGLSFFKVGTKPPEIGKLLGLVDLNLDQ